MFSFCFAFIYADKKPALINIGMDVIRKVTITAAATHQLGGFFRSQGRTAVEGQTFLRTCHESNASIAVKLHWFFLYSREYLPLDSAEFFKTRVPCFWLQSFALALL
jgi:hypothetical protein